MGAVPLATVQHICTPSTIMQKRTLTNVTAQRQLSTLNNKHVLHLSVFIISEYPSPPPPTNKVEVYPRPDGTISIGGIGGSDYISTSELQASAYLDECLPKMDRVEAASSAFHMISNSYATKGELSHAQACKYFCYRCIVS